jgi:hypothetical protein
MWAQGSGEIHGVFLPPHPWEDLEGIPSLGTGIKRRGRHVRLVSSSDEACSQSGSDNDTAAEEQAEFERVQVLLVLQGITKKMDEMIQLLQLIQNKTDTVPKAHKTPSSVRRQHG